jgi:hypothetical protein
MPEDRQEARQGHLTPSLFEFRPRLLPTGPTRRTLLCGFQDSNQSAMMLGIPAVESRMEGEDAPQGFAASEDFSRAGLVRRANVMYCIPELANTGEWINPRASSHTEVVARLKQLDPSIDRELHAFRQMSRVGGPMSRLSV